MVRCGFKTAHPVLILLILPPRVVEPLNLYWCAAAAAAEIFVCVSRVVCGGLFWIPPGVGLPNAVMRRGFHCGHGRTDSRYFHSSSNGHTTIGSVSVANRDGIFGADLRINDENNQNILRSRTGGTSEHSFIFLRACSLPLNECVRPNRFSVIYFDY